METNDYAKAAPYNMNLIVYYSAYENYLDHHACLFEKQFTIEVVDYCVPTSVSKISQFVPAMLTQVVG